MIILVLFAFGWRVGGLTYQSLWRDEVDTIRFASRPLPELVATFAKPGENGPLFFLLMHPWLSALGQSEFVLRLPAAFFGVLAVPLTFLLAGTLLRLWQPSLPRSAQLDMLQNVPLLAALLVAINPYLVWYSQEGKMYAQLVTLVLITHLAFLAALQNGLDGKRTSMSARWWDGWWRWLVYLVLVSISVLTHTLAILIPPVHFVWLLILWPRYRRRWPAFWLTILLPIVPYFLVFGWWQARLFLSAGFETGHTFFPLTDMTSILLAGFGRGMAMSTPPWLWFPLIFLLLTGALIGGTGLGKWRDRETSADNQRYHYPRRLSAMIVTWLVLPPLLLFLISLQKPLFTDRYLIWIGPAFALLVAIGIVVLSRLWRPLGWIALTFLVGLGLMAGWRQTHVPVKSDFRRAAEFVESRRLVGDLVLFQIPYGRYTYEYYAGTTSPVADGPYTNNGNPYEQVDAEMMQAIGSATTVWFVVSEEGLWDARRLTRAWLEDHGQSDERETFARVEVIRYQLPP
jgi:4-amino-4-deoxy-L-arabinose transferase-like glycosyltransferase